MDFERIFFASCRWTSFSKLCPGFLVFLLFGGSSERPQVSRADFFFQEKPNCQTQALLRPEIKLRTTDHPPSQHGPGARFGQNIFWQNTNLVAPESGSSDLSQILHVDLPVHVHVLIIASKLRIRSCLIDWLMSVLLFFAKTNSAGFVCEKNRGKRSQTPEKY